jgi:hypothetical protein
MKQIYTSARLLFNTNKRGNKMSKTRHIKIKMNQRAIDEQLIKIVLNFGATQTRGMICKYFLSKKNIDATLERIDKLRCQIMKAKDKGGLVLVANKDNGLQITTYRMNEFIKAYRTNFYPNKNGNHHAL